MFCILIRIMLDILFPRNFSGFHGERLVFFFFVLREEVERDVKPLAPASNTADYDSECKGAVIFHLFFEALRSDVFNFPPRARSGKGGPGPNANCDRKVMRGREINVSSRDRDLIARYILRAPHTYTRVHNSTSGFMKWRALSFSLSFSLILSLSRERASAQLAKLNSTCPISSDLCANRDNRSLTFLLVHLNASTSSYVLR